MKQIIVIRTDLKMGVGKQISQGAHASLGAMRATELLNDRGRSTARAWRMSGQAKIVVSVGSRAELLDLSKQAERAGIGFYVVRDHGRTEVEAGTATACAIGPDTRQRLDPITGELSLLR